MIYRRKTYKVQPETLEDFNKHFNNTLLAAQLKYGSRLVGRWMNKQNDGIIEVFAIWEYDSYEAYERIEKSVRGDKEHVKRVQDWYDKIGRENVQKLKSQIKEEFIETTVPRDRTILSTDI